MCVCAAVDAEQSGSATVFQSRGGDNPPEGVCAGALRHCGPCVSPYFNFSRPPCVVFYCPLQSPLQQAAAACTALVPASSAPRFCVVLNGAMHSGYCSASPGRVSWHMAGMTACKDYNTQSVPGAYESIRLQHIRGGGSAESDMVFK